MKELFNEINNILAEWNPIDVPQYIALHEYTTYVKYFIDIRKDLVIIQNELINILINKIGLNYDDNNVIQKEEIIVVAKKILEVLYNQ